MEQEQTATSEKHPGKDTPDLRTLLKEAHLSLENFDNETAGTLLRKALDTYPDNDKVLFEYGNFLYEQGEIHEAHSFLAKAVELAPERNSNKYFILAQICDIPEQTKKLYLKGLEIASKKIAQLKQDFVNSTKNHKKIKNLSRLTAQAFCGLAQLEVSGAGPFFEAFDTTQFLGYITKAIEADQYYLEAYSQLALYYFNIQDETMCRKTLSEIVSRVHELEDKGAEDELSEFGPEFFIPLVRMMVEGEIWEEGSYLIETGLQQDSRNLEANYLYAFCLFKDEEFEQSVEICQEMEKLGVMKCGDEELITGFIELKEEIKKALENLQSGVIESLPDSDDDWIEDD